MNAKTKDRLLGVILLLISLFFFLFTMQQESPRFEGDPGPKMFPLIGCAITAVCGVLTLVHPEGKEKKAYLGRDLGPGLPDHGAASPVRHLRALLLRVPPGRSDREAAHPQRGLRGRRRRSALSALRHGPEDAAAHRRAVEAVQVREGTRYVAIYS